MKKLTTLLILIGINSQAFGGHWGCLKSDPHPFGRPPETEVACYNMHHEEAKARLLKGRERVNDGDIEAGAEQSTCCSGRAPKWMCYTTACLSLSAAAIVIIASYEAIAQALEKNGNATHG